VIEEWGDKRDCTGRIEKKLDEIDCLPEQTPESVTAGGH
jgi:hypothetical protein